MELSKQTLNVRGQNHFYMCSRSNIFAFRSCSISGSSGGAVGVGATPNIHIVLFKLKLAYLAFLTTFIDKDTKSTKLNVFIRYAKKKIFG